MCLQRLLCVPAFMRSDVTRSLYTQHLLNLYAFAKHGMHAHQLAKKGLLLL